MKSHELTSKAWNYAWTFEAKVVPLWQRCQDDPIDQDNPFGQDEVTQECSNELDELSQSYDSYDSAHSKKPKKPKT